MSWSDAIRTEAAFLAIDAVPPPTADLHQFGMLGTALWKERCRARPLSSALPSHALECELERGDPWL
ncbi:MAG: hypothetical protein M3Z29_10870 [Pseudomonadota bacterium]|nr:hypothetical protein [Pseudomonadota bacterium]